MCEFIMKTILIITNVVVMVAGAIMLVAGVVFFTKKFDFFPDLKDYSTNVNSILIPMMVIGGVLFLVGVAGCFGAATGKSGLLNIYFVVLLVVLVLEIIVVVLAIVKKQAFVDATEDAAKKLFEKYKKQFVEEESAEELTDITEILAVNSAQSIFHCCGLTKGPSYWKTDSQTDVPPGCCSDWNGEDIPELKLESCAEDKIYKTGCTEKVNDLADQFGVIILIIVASVMAFEILCLIAACCSKKNDQVLA
ncbi:23 kDa integral membrane protein-like [Bolinopsis microptera]|uniref:23 kDa integral membrane protein-like n=1 Tax=Bolinopsis microptera TaxID=2820187 RepID=UPI003078A6E1